MGKKLKSFAEWRLQENLREYNFYMKKFERLLLNMFTWENLPCGISERFIEDKLYRNGLLIFYKSKEKGFYLVSQATPIGLNDYEEPTGYRTYTTSGISEIVKAEDCVPIWNDYLREGNISNVNFFAKRLSNIEKTIDINLEQMKNPFIIECSEGQKETIEQVFAQKTDGVPYILVSDDFAKNIKTNVFNLDIKDFTKPLNEMKHSIINEALTFFGINNVNIMKKERLITSEAEQNDEQIYLDRNIMYKARKKAVEEINNKFNLDISVSLAIDDIISNIENLGEGETDV